MHSAFRTQHSSSGWNRQIIINSVCHGRPGQGRSEERKPMRESSGRRMEVHAHPMPRIAAAGKPQHLSRHSLLILIPCPGGQAHWRKRYSYRDAAGFPPRRPQKARRQHRKHLPNRRSRNVCLYYISSEITCLQLRSCVICRHVNCQLCLFPVKMFKPLPSGGPRRGRERCPAGALPLPGGEMAHTRPTTCHPEQMEWSAAEWNASKDPRINRVLSRHDGA